MQKQKYFKLIQVLFVVLFFIPSAQAAFSPLSVNIAPPVQFPPSDYSVTGARLSLGWGKHRDVYGIDLGLIGNITEQDFAGLSVSGLFNMTKGPTTIVGLQLAGLTNINTNKTNVVGIQAALAVNSNSAAATVSGLQIAAINLAPNTNINGFQVGVYNKALVVRGFQIGLVNVTKTLYGLQIGLINFNQDGFFNVSPILNVGF